MRSHLPLHYRFMPASRVWGGIACAFLLLGGWAAGVSARAGTLGKAHKLTEPDRISILRTMVAAIGFSRHSLPRGKHPIKLSSTGRILNLHEIHQQVRNSGIAIPRGGRVQITAIHFHSHSIDFDLNGGPQTSHWYNHLQFGIGNGPMNSIPNQGRIGGGRITLRFHGQVPALTTAEIRKELSPIIEWNLREGSAIARYHLPPVVRKAIHRHHVLVGMDRSMVVAALGRTQRKYHEQNVTTGEVYTDWVYGKPPAKTTFVRLEGNRVVRVVTYFPDGHRIVRDQPQVLIVQRQAPVAPAADSGPRPSLHRHPSLKQQPESAPLPMQDRPIVTKPQINPNAPGATSPSSVPNNTSSDGTGTIPH